LDLLFAHLIDIVFAGKSFFDFGRSTESDGRILKVGLVAFKEGFGARTVVHDSYALVL
jgi:hypothetical protein